MTLLLEKMIAWSRKTFGPGTRAEMIYDHLQKEMKELKLAQESKRSEEIIGEYVDIAMIAIDGIWRMLEYDPIEQHERYLADPDNPDLNTNYELAHSIMHRLNAKLAVNKQREWPDWRTVDANKAIEHIRPE